MKEIMMAVAALMALTGALRAEGRALGILNNTVATKETEVNMPEPVATPAGKVFFQHWGGKPGNGNGFFKPWSKIGTHSDTGPAPENAGAAVSAEAMNSTFPEIGSQNRANCEDSLKGKLLRDPNIRLVGISGSYTCGADACALTYIHDASPYQDQAVLAFLDKKSGVEVKWVPIENRSGHQEINKDMSSYVSIRGNSGSEIELNTSIETPRDSIFWPPHRVYFSETVTCVKR